MTRTNQRHALVTGATSGIGRAVASELGHRGYAVYICARSAGDVADTVKALRHEGIEADGSCCDVRRREQVQVLIGAAAGGVGPVDVLVNNPGRGGGGITAELTDELWYDVVDTNLNSVFLMTREALTAGGLAGREGGRIISIASTGGKQGVIYGAPYSAAKHGVVGFTKALGLELAKTGVTVNAVCPGYVETPLAGRVRRGHAEHFGITEDEVQARFEAKIPIGRYTTAEEVAGLVGYLTTEAAAPVTAQAINVCGGLGNY
jgi:ketoreductase